MVSLRLVPLAGDGPLLSFGHFPLQGELPLVGDGPLLSFGHFPLQGELPLAGDGPLLSFGHFPLQGELHSAALTTHCVVIHYRLDHRPLQTLGKSFREP